MFPSKFFSQELDDGLEPVGGGDLVEVLFHNGGIADCFESHDDYRAAGSGRGEWNKNAVEHMERVRCTDEDG